MLDINEQTNTELYYDVEKCVEFCKNIKDTVHKEFTNYHMFWNVGLQFERKQLLPIKSYISTQNLRNTSLNVWSNVDLTENRFLKPFLPYINLKIWNPIEEAKGTLLENRTDILSPNDQLNWCAGDLFRILVLHKYGGLYVDFDVVFLRDFAPLLNQEFMYKWSFQKEMINGAVMRMYKCSKLSNDLLNEIYFGSVIPGTTNWSTDLYQKVRKYNTNWTIFPCAFFNTEWQIEFSTEEKKNPSNFELFDFIRYPFKRTSISNTLYDGVFSWHWHNNWDVKIEEGSKWQILESKFDQIIKNNFGIKSDYE